MWMVWLTLGHASGGIPRTMWDRCVTEETLTVPDREYALGLVEAAMSGAYTEGSFDALVDRAPQCPAVWMARAGRWHAQGEPSRALADLERAAEVGPDWPEVHRALAVALHGSGGAGEALDRAIELAPDDHLLKLLQAAERPVSERPALLKKAVDAHPEDLEVALAAVDALVEAGRPLEAIALARERNTQLDDPALSERIAELEAPFVIDETERARRPGEFRTLEDGTEEVVVYSPARARAELDKRLRDLGYTNSKPIAGGTRYRSNKPITPFVEVYDDGRVFVQEKGKIKPPTNTLPTAGSTMIPYISARKMRPRRVRVLEDIWYEVTVWRQARIRVAFQEQLGERLPDQLTELWEEGRPMYGEGRLDDAAARRVALLDYWATRACSADGDAARVVVERFLARVVQESDQPASAAEIAAAEEACRCDGTTLDLDVAP